MGGGRLVVLLNSGPSLGNGLLRAADVRPGVAAGAGEGERRIFFWYALAVHLPHLVGDDIEGRFVDDAFPELEGIPRFVQFVTTALEFVLNGTSRLIYRLNQDGHAVVELREHIEIHQVP